MLNCVRNLYREHYNKEIKREKKMADKTNEALAYNCLNCGAPLRFDPTIGKLKCDHCDSEFTVEEIEESFGGKESQSEAKSTDEEWKTYSCSTCGAELMADLNTAVMVCPYCGNNTIATAQFAGSIRPDLLIPFSVTKDQAVKSYEEYYKKGFKKLLLPKSFINDNHVQEIQGVYIPFWLFKGRADIEGTYYAEDSHDEGDYEVTEKYKAYRQGNMSFDRVPADASKRMADNLMDSIEPYDFKSLKSFSMSYLPGFLAERFDVDEQDDRERAKKRVEGTIKQKTRATIKHEKVDEDRVQVDVEFQATEYALLPAYLLTTGWKDKSWTFAMNGQTGKFIGDLPISVGKFILLLLLSFLIPFILVSMLSGTDVAIFAGIIVAVITGLASRTTMKPVHRAIGADDYMEKNVNLTGQNEEYIGSERRKKDDSK